MYKFKNKDAESLSRADINELLDQYNLIKQELELINKNLIEKQKILDAFLNDSPFFISFIKDDEYRIIMASKKFGNIFNKETEELLYKTNHELFPKDFADKSCLDDQKVLDGKIAIIEENFLGKYYFVYKFPLTIDDKKFVGGYISANIQGVNIINKLKQNIEIYSNMIRNVYNVLILTDLEGKISNVSKGTTMVYEYTYEEMLDMYIYDLVENKYDCIVFNEELKNELIEKEVLSTERHNLISKNGIVFYSKCNIYSLRDNDGKPSYFLFNFNRIYK